MELTCLVRRDIFLEAFLRWIAPLLAACWITGIAVVKAAWAFSTDCSSMAMPTLLMAFFTRVRLDLFRKFLTLFCLARLIADLCVAKVIYPFLIDLKDSI